MVPRSQHREGLKAFSPFGRVFGRSREGSDPSTACLLAPLRSRRKERLRGSARGVCGVCACAVRRLSLPKRGTGSAALGPKSAAPRGGPGRYRTPEAAAASHCALLPGRRSHGGCERKHREQGNK